jgi:NAD(P)-dependent dehydrogenase (short-subunit alcohol dehydrogenase family)
MQKRSIVVTGAFGNLGFVVAQRFRQEGCRVALLDCADAPPELAKQFGEPHCVLGGIDLTGEQSAATAMAAVRQRLGSIDVLVNVAGGFRWQTVEEGGANGWDILYAVNLKTALLATKAALPHLASSAGRIINIGAGAAARAATAGMGAYAAAKAGVHKLTESLADELKDRQITVNAVLPGIIDTPQNRTDMPTADFSRWVAPAAIAEVIVFLASDKAAAVTGALIPVSGRG